MKYPAQVYAIVFAEKGKIYVGLSHNPQKRFAAHQNLLKAGRHPVEDFQADYDASEGKRLGLVVLEDVASEDERHKEHRWQVALHTYEREHGYNYKDPTARRETERAENRKRCKAFLKDSIRRAVHATNERSQH